MIEQLITIYIGAAIIGITYIAWLFCRARSMWLILKHASGVGGDSLKIC